MISFFMQLSEEEVEKLFEYTDRSLEEYELDDSEEIEEALKEIIKEL